MPNSEEARKVIVFLNMGGPEKLDDVPEFLRLLFSDKELIDLPLPMKIFQPMLARLISFFRSKGTKNMYRQIGGGSPILKLTRELAQNVQLALQAKGFNVAVEIAMRYSEPRAYQVIENLEETDKVILFSQYPHYAKSTSGSSINEFLSLFIQRFPEKEKPKIIDEWGTEDFYVNWWTNEIRNELIKLEEKGIKEDIHVIFTSHGLPLRYIRKGETYQQSIDRSRNKIIESLGKLNVEFHQAYQSRAGPFPWLQPYTDELIEELAGSSALIMVPLGFVTDHVETSYEIDILYGDLARANGIKNFVRVRVPNGNKEYANEMAEFLVPILQEGERK